MLENDAFTGYICREMLQVKIKACLKLKLKLLIFVSEIWTGAFSILLKLGKILTDKYSFKLCSFCIIARFTFSESHLFCELLFTCGTPFLTSSWSQASRSWPAPACRTHTAFTLPSVAFSSMETKLRMTVFQCEVGELKKIHCQPLENDDCVTLLYCEYYKCTITFWWHVTFFLVGEAVPLLKV